MVFFICWAVLGSSSSDKKQSCSWGPAACLSKGGEFVTGGDLQPMAENIKSPNRHFHVSCSLEK